MEKFLTQCLNNLESLTGIRQLYFLEQDLDGARKISVLIKGMLIVCGQFDYIPEKDQQKIVSDMMVKDQDYDAMNSRTLYKWFNLHKDFYWTKANSEQDSEIDNSKLPPLSEETLKKIAEFQAGLLERAEPKFLGLNLTMEQIRYEDSMRLEGEETKLKGTPSNMPAWVVPIEDDEGNVIKEISNVLAPTQEKAQALVELSIREGKIKI
jgi:hypothetical protein